MRAALADGLEKISAAKPDAVAVDLILAEPNAADDKLEAAFAGTRNLVLSCDLLPDDSGWEAIRSGVPGNMPSPQVRFMPISKQSTL